VRDQISHPHRTAGNIFLYVLTVMCSGSKRENKRLWIDWQVAFVECIVLIS